MNIINDYKFNMYISSYSSINKLVKNEKFEEINKNSKKGYDKKGQLIKDSQIGCLFDFYV